MGSFASFCVGVRSSMHSARVAAGHAGSRKEGKRADEGDKKRGEGGVGGSKRHPDEGKTLLPAIHRVGLLGGALQGGRGNGREGKNRG